MRRLKFPKSHHMKNQLKFAKSTKSTKSTKSIMKNTTNKSFSRHAITNVARLVAIAAVCVTMSALTFAKPPIAPPIATPASQSNQSSLVSASCVGDLNHNGSVDSEDLGILLTAYGPCPGCEEDLYADGNVNSADLGVLLIQSGVCPAPTVTAISPASGLTSGGTTITLNGTNFFGASSVTVGGTLATSVNVVSASVLTAVTPAGSIGSAVSVSVTTPGGTGTLAGAFSYYEAGTLSWASVLEALPNATVVPDATVRANIVASGYPWRVLDTGTGIEMLLIPSGTFTMGCSASNSYSCYSSENPTHQVTLSKAFYLGKTEVTQAQWQAKMGSNPSYFQPPNYTLDTSRPVEKVRWNDIAGFNTATGLRLPSEAEWEYACRGGTTTAFHSMLGYPNGTNDDSLLGNIAWCSSNSGDTTHAVAGKAANAFGMYDMLGNVWEWCNDWYGSTYYSASPSADPVGPSSGSYRVLRGGIWGSDGDNCRSSDRYYGAPGSRNYFFGFRVARTP
jgi:formylglycine-generating enzyme required for sulfatase activity